MAVRKPAASRRRDIADAALKVIAEQGLARFTSLAIAREVGVSDAALFRHFATKEDIVLAVIDRVEEILFADFPPAERNPIDRLGLFFQRRIASKGSTHQYTLALGLALAAFGSGTLLAQVTLDPAWRVTGVCPALAAPYNSHGCYDSCAG